MRDVHITDNSGGGGVGGIVLPVLAVVAGAVVLMSLAAALEHLFVILITTLCVVLMAGAGVGVLAYWYKVAHPVEARARQVAPWHRDREALAAARPQVASPSRPQVEGGPRTGLARGGDLHLHIHGTDEAAEAVRRVREEWER